MAPDDPPAQDDVEPTAPAGFDRLIGLEFASASADRVEASLVVRAEHLQPFGILHGGVLCALVESVASVGGWFFFREHGHVVGVGNSTDFLHGVREGAELTAVGTPIHRGRTLQLWQVEIREGDRLVARGQLRLANLASRRTGGAPAATV